MTPGRMRSWIVRIRRILWNGLAIFGLGVLVYVLCFDVARVVSGSMAPTLQGESRDNGDTLLSERITFAVRPPRRWEIVAFRSADDRVLVKRVVGLPGETVQLTEGGEFAVDGKPVPRPPSLAAVKYLRFGNLAAGQIAPCGDGYYVLGDDSRDSDDSRFNGPVSADDIVARPWLIVGPSGRRGWVQPQF